MPTETLTTDFLLFDLDGTLVSTTEAAEKAYTKLCVKYGVDPVELFKFSHGTRTADVFKQFFPEIDNTDNKAVAEFELSIANDYLDSVSLIGGAKDLLLTLKNSDQQKWAIVTSGTHHIAFSWFKSILADVGKPDVFITALDVTHGKPDPEGYNKAAEILSEKYGVKHPRTVVFEDAPVGIQAGLAIGAITIGITSTYPKERLFEAGAHYVVEDLTQVKLLQNSDTGIVLEIDYLEK